MITDIDDFNFKTTSTWIRTLLLYQTNFNRPPQEKLIEMDGYLYLEQNI